MARSGTGYFARKPLARPTAAPSKSAVFPPEVESESCFDSRDEGVYCAEVVKDVLTSNALPSPASLIEEESTSESSLSETEAEHAGPEQGSKEFIDPYPDFQWMTTEEPHRSRRMAILKAHPEVSLSLSRSRMVSAP